MKILRLFTALAIAALTFAACDDTTDTIGGTITNNVDSLYVSSAMYNVISESYVPDSVLSRSNSGLIGKVKDPETNNYITGDYMTQFGVLSSFSTDTLQYIKNANDGKLEADSCILLVSYTSTYGDTIAPMKVAAYEMSKPMTEDKYYSNYDAFSNGWVSEDNYHSTATYNLCNKTAYKNFKIYLNKEYKKNGKTYKNYGSYILQTFEEHPEYFKTNYRFLHKVCPGFYIKNVGGIGNVANIWNTEILFYWTRHKTVQATDGSDSTAVGAGYSRFDGTEEVLQLNKITNDKEGLRRMAADENCTYLKSPAGIFTIATLPVEEIMEGHEKDTLNTATVTFPRMNNEDADNKYQLNTPSTILMVQADSVYSFFEKAKITDNRTSFVASYNSTSTGVKNAYTFSNIANLVSAMYKQKGKSDNWNKVALIPVKLITSTQSSSTVITKINHDMSLTSTRLVKGKITTDSSGKESSPIQIKVIYSKFKEK